MTQQTKTALDTQVDTLFADNVTEDITPFRLRTHLKDMQESMPNLTGISTGTVPLMSTDGYTIEDSSITEDATTVTISKPVIASNLSEIGFADYNDLGTTASPITFSAGSEVRLTNDNNGANSSNRLPTGVTDVWIPGTSQFDWSELSIGDEIDIRIDLQVDINSANELLTATMYFGVGTAFEFGIPLIADKYFRYSDSYRVVESTQFYVGSDLTKDNPGELRLVCTGSGEVTVNGWYVRVIKKG